MKNRLKLIAIETAIGLASLVGCSQRHEVDTNSNYLSVENSEVYVHAFDMDNLRKVSVETPSGDELTIYDAKNHKEPISFLTPVPVPSEIDGKFVLKVTDGNGNTLIKKYNSIKYIEEEKRHYGFVNVP